MADEVKGVPDRYTPTPERIDQFLRIIRSLLGSDDPTKMTKDPSEWKMNLDQLLPLMLSDGSIGRTFTFPEQKYFEALLRQKMAEQVPFAREYSSGYLRP